MMKTAGRGDQSTPTLVFVYNAEGGLFNALSDMAHKIFSPETYQCNLCALTHGSFRMRRSWKQFLGSLEAKPEFLHADELREGYGLRDVPLPAIFQKRDGVLEPLIDSSKINACRTLDDLERLITESLPSRQTS
jgi:hypothetical protein